VTLRALATIILAIVLVLAASGCGGESLSVSPETPGSTPITSTLSADVSAEPTGEAPSAGSSAEDVLQAGSVGAELDAMERELDQRDMPADGDFSDAEGALY
jgi:hypothetical protein